MIDLQTIAIGIDDLLGVVRIIANGPREVRCRIQRKESSRYGIPSAQRDGVIREGGPRRRIVDSGRKNALTLGGDGDRGDLRRRVAFPRTLPAPEEEGFVLDNRAAKGRAELVLNKQSAAARGLEVGRGVQLGVAQKLEDVSVETVGS